MISADFRTVTIYPYEGRTYERHFALATAYIDWTYPAGARHKAPTEDTVIKVWAILRRDGQLP